MDELLTWLSSDDLGQEKVGLLVLCVLAIYVVSAQLAWRLSCASAGRGIVAAVGRSWFGRWAAQVVRLFYYLGIPLAVLWRGALVREMGIPTTFVGRWDGNAILDLLGVAEPEDVLRLGTGLALGGGALCAMIVVWVWYARTVLAEQGPPAGEPLPAVPWWEALREALFLQMVWALYRGFVLALTLDRPQAAFVSLALIGVSWVLDPRRRHDLFTSRGYLVVQDWLSALFTAFVSLEVHMLWLLVLMHTAWIWVSGHVLAHLSRNQGIKPVACSRAG